MGLLAVLNLWPPFSPGAGEVVAVTATFREALRARILAAPGLEAVGPRVFWARTARAAYPHIRIFPIGGDRKSENSSDSYYLERTLQFSVLATDDEQCEDLATALRDALEWDASEPLLFVEGYEMARFLDDLWMPREEGGIGPGGEDVWHSHIDITHLIGVDGGEDD